MKLPIDMGMLYCLLLSAKCRYLLDSEPAHQIPEAMCSKLAAVPHSPHTPTSSDKALCLPGLHKRPRPFPCLRSRMDTNAAKDWP